MNIHIRSIFLTLTFIILPLTSNATSWPVFLPPSIDFLLKQGYIDTLHCPPGQGKISANATVNIHQSLCKTFCPDTWEWVSRSDEACHDVNSGFNFQSYNVSYDRDDEGVVNNSVIIANYGDNKDGPAAVRFVFTSPPDEHWYCFEKHTDLHTITCGNDI